MRKLTVSGIVAALLFGSCGFDLSTLGTGGLIIQYSLEWTCQSPRGIAVTSESSTSAIYVVSTESVFKFDSTGELLHSWDMPLGPAFEKTNILDIAINKNGQIVALTQADLRIFDADLTLLSSPAPIAVLVGGCFGITCTDASDILVTSLIKSRVYIYDQYGAPNSDMAFFSTGTVGESQPNGIGSDGLGHVYISDVSADPHIQQFTVDGTLEMEWGGLGDDLGDFATDPGPTNLTCTADGEYVFVCDTGNDRIQVFSRDGVYVTQFGKYGSEAYEFSEPTAIAIDSSDHIYIADTKNNRVQVYSLTRAASP